MCLPPCFAVGLFDLQSSPRNGFNVVDLRVSASSTAPRCTACSIAFPVPGCVGQQLLVCPGDLSSEGFKNLVVLQPDESAAYGYGLGVHRLLLAYLAQLR